MTPLLTHILYNTPMWLNVTSLPICVRVSVSITIVAPGKHISFSNPHFVSPNGSVGYLGLVHQPLKNRFEGGTMSTVKFIFLHLVPHGSWWWLRFQVFFVATIWELCEKSLQNKMELLERFFDSKIKILLHFFSIQITLYSTFFLCWESSVYLDYSK